MDRMEREARAVKGTGVIGADITVEVEPRRVDLGNDQHRLDMVYHFTAIGTVIAPCAGGVHLDVATAVSML